MRRQIGTFIDGVEIDVFSEYINTINSLDRD